MAVVVSMGAKLLAESLNARHAGYGVFKVMPGRRFDKIVVTPNQSSQTFVHAFVECETGHVFKPNGWKSPANGVRFTSWQDAAKVSDPYGGYLYAR